MRDRFENLSYREKQYVAGGAVALALVLFYLIFLAPLSNKVDSLREQIIRDQKLVVWMQDADTRIQQLEKTQQPVARSADGSLLNNVQDQINKSPFRKSMTQLQSAENDSVQLHLQKVGFDSFMKWLIPLCQQQQLTIKQLTAKPVDAPGVVDIDLKLS